MNSGGNKSPGLGVGAYISAYFSHFASPAAPGNIAFLRYLYLRVGAVPSVLLAPNFSGGWLAI